MGWVFDCSKVQSTCRWRSESVGSRADAKQLGLIHLKNVHRISVDRNWEKLAESAVR